MYIACVCILCVFILCFEMCVCECICVCVCVLRRFAVYVVISVFIGDHRNLHIDLNTFFHCMHNKQNVVYICSACGDRIIAYSKDTTYRKSECP